MIWTSIQAIALNILNWFLGILPNSDPSVIYQITSQTGNFRNTLTYANWIFPVDQVLLMFSMVMTIEGFIFIWRAFNWIVNHIPFVRV